MVWQPLQVTLTRILPLIQNFWWDSLVVGVGFRRALQIVTRLFNALCHILPLPIMSWRYNKHLIIGSLPHRSFRAITFRNTNQALCDYQLVSFYPILLNHLRSRAASPFSYLAFFETKRWLIITIRLIRQFDYLLSCWSGGCRVKTEPIVLVDYSALPPRIHAWVKDLDVLG